MRVSRMCLFAGESLPALRSCFPVGRGLLVVCASLPLDAHVFLTLFFLK